MLSYPDRQRFQQIRARWEASQPVGAATSKMAGRKDKPPIHQPRVNDENSGPGKFRRKISDGLSFIVNPLSQRKTLPAQQPQQQTGHSLTTNAPPINVPGPFHQSHLYDKASSSGPVHLQQSSMQSQPPKAYKDTTEETELDTDMTPKPLPRSRTTSFIPRPSRRASGSSTTGSDTGTVIRLPACDSRLDARDPPSKIPTPSPPASFRRHTSAQNSTTKIRISSTEHGKPDAVSNGAAAQSHPAVHLYTVPVVRDIAHPSQSSRVSGIPPKTPVKPEYSLFRPSPARDSLTLPYYQARRYSKGLSKIPESSPNRQNTTIPTANTTNTTPRANVTHEVNIHEITATPPTTHRRDSHLVMIEQAPKYLQATPKGDVQTHNDTTASSCLNRNPIAHTRLLGPVNPPTPPTVKSVPLRLSLPQSLTDRNSELRSYSPVSRREDLRSSKLRVGVDREVRLPQSSTFPIMPSVPEQQKNQSLPLIIKDEAEYLSDHRLMGLEKGDTFGTFAKPYQTNGDVRKHADQNRPKAPDSTTRPGKKSSYPKEGPILSARPPRSFSGPFRFFSLPTTWPKSLPRSATIQHLKLSADIEDPTQVRNYMPTSYWAGRFQSHFDQWRTQVMTREMEACEDFTKFRGSDEMNHEDKAICYIFLQLRDLCISSQAADSLWVSKRHSKAN